MQRKGARKRKNRKGNEGEVMKRLKVDKKR